MHRIHLVHFVSQVPVPICYLPVLVHHFALSLQVFLFFMHQESSVGVGCTAQEQSARVNAWTSWNLSLQISGEPMV